MGDKIDYLYFNTLELSQPYQITNAFIAFYERQTNW